MQELCTVRLSIIANLPHRHEFFGCRLVFKAKQRNCCLAAFQQLGHISFLLMNSSVGFVLTPILHRFQIICRYDLFPIKEQNVHDISEYIIIVCQQFLGNIFLCHISLSFLSGPPLCSYIVPKQCAAKEVFSIFTALTLQKRSLL